ncbi:MAG TPA: enoyl-CoA hydratase-related protein, partial [Actinoallomurus sp.]|nr:enoyl-CoA hydratase-related protein [Actinoallomurus sp.]
MPESVQYELAEGVATITLARPDAMNSLTVETKTELRDAVERARDDTAVRAVVLTGSGRAFCAGQDLREHAANLEAGLGLAGTLEHHYDPIVLAL